MTTQARGLQPLSLTTAQRGALTAAQRPTGTIVYDNELDEVVLWNGASWIILGDGPGSLIFKGTINPTTTDPIADPDDGDFYISNASGNFTSNWGALAGLGVTVNDRIIFTNNNWANFPTGEATDLQAVTTQGATTTDTITVGGLTTLGTVDAASTETDTLNVSGISTFQSHVELGDDDELRLGNNNDLRLYHDGSNSYVADNGSGYLILASTFGGVLVRKHNSTETMAGFNPDSSVDFYYNGVKKFETTSSGVTITGNATATTFIGNVTGDVTGDLTGTASQLNVGSAIGDATWRPLAAFGNSQDPTNVTSTSIKHAGSDTPILRGDGRVQFQENVIATGNIEGVNITASGNLNGTLGNSQTRNAIAQHNDGAVGTYGFLTTNDNSNQQPGNQKSGSNMRWSNAAAAQTNSTPSGSWRQMGRVAGDSSDFGERQSTLFLRYV